MTGDLQTEQHTLEPVHNHEAHFDWTHPWMFSLYAAVLAPTVVFAWWCVKRRMKRNMM